MDALKFISEQMGVISVPYEFGEWTQKITYPYFVGEIVENEPLTEDGAEESTVILDGFHRGKYIDLEMAKAKIKQHFDPIHGLRGRTDSGAIAVFFAGAMYVPSGEAELKHIQITLKIKQWKGAI